MAVDPCRYWVAVDHRVLVGDIRTSQQLRNVQPVVGPILEMVDEFVDLHRLEPSAALPAMGIVHRHLGDPIDGR